jgi:hypothetical protein
MPALSTAEVTSVKLKAEQWDIPRHGETLLKQPELAKIVRLWLDHPEAKIEMRYPGGEEGELWVGELMDWLIALGIPSSAINRIPGSGAEDVIHLVLVPGVAGKP